MSSSPTRQKPVGYNGSRTSTAPRMARSARADVGGTTSFGYDTYGQLSLISYPASLGSEGFLNNALGDTLSRTNARGFITSFQYNNRRQLTNTIALTNLTAKIAYDAVANVLSTTDRR